MLHRVDLTRWRDEGRARAALERVPCLIVLDTDQRPTAEFADIVFPLATYVESEGTFTNHAGRVQRFLAAVKPPGEARAGWLALGELLGDLSDEAPPASAGAVFAALAGASAPFAGLGYERLGLQGEIAGAAPTP